MYRRQKGMTLIEVVLSMTLLSLVILTFAYVFIQSQAATTDNGTRQTALQLAQKHLSAVLSGSRLPEPAASQPSPPSSPQNVAHYRYEGSETVGDASYKTFVFVLNKDEDQNQPVVIRTFYGAKYVELYNYYTTNGQ
jgi:prepilin-type N-terminal cleavage/methylation domain-containing protein